jgi:hypothetical protein
MKIVTALSALLLLALLCVPSVSAGGMVKFHVSPVADPKVGDTITATIYSDNNLAPRIGDVVLMLDWNPEVMRYASSTVEQGRTTADDMIGTHNLEIRAADTANGLPNGDGALATVTFKVVGPGFTPIVVDVRSVHDVTGADITAKAVSQNGAVTATGTAGTTVLTTAPTTASTTIAPILMPNPVVTISAPAPVTVIEAPGAVVTVEPVLVAPVELSPAPSPEVLPTVTSAGSGRSRFGTRTYVVGTVPKNPPTGIIGGSGRAVGIGVRSSRLGAGIADGIRPPSGRFVRWSPVTRWRYHTG